MNSMKRKIYMLSIYLYLGEEMKTQMEMRKVNLRYLKLKNKLFFSTARILQKAKLLHDSLVWLRDETEEFFDLLGLYFQDEEGYQRALFIPWPVVYATDKRIARLLTRMVDSLEIKAVSRDWHDFNIRGKPASYYPPAEYYDYEEDEEVS